jgi:allantoin racemase
MMSMREEAAVRRQAPKQRLLILNPNTNAAVTQGIRAAALRVVEAETEITVLNPLIGPHSIETSDDRVEAEPQLIALLRENLPRRFDAYVLGCFDDIGLFAARALAQGPVVGTCEAGIAAARTMARRFSIITTVHSAVPGIHSVLKRYGATDICTVRAAGIGVADAASGSGNTEAKLLQTIREAIETDGAEVILLGSGGLAGKAPTLRAHVPVPVIDGIQAAVKMAEGLAVQLR